MAVQVIKRYCTPRWLVFFLTLLLSQATWGGERIALVIGNNAYAEKPLTNPINDATAIAKVLKAPDTPQINLRG